MALLTSKVTPRQPTFRNAELDHVIEWADVPLPPKKRTMQTGS